MELLILMETCNNCNYKISKNQTEIDSGKASQRVLVWDSTTMSKAWICRCCFLSDSKDKFKLTSNHTYETYPVKGLHYGDNS